MTEKTDDEAEAISLIRNSPDVTETVMDEPAPEAASKPEREAPETDERLAELAGKAADEAMNGFGVEASPTLTSLFGQLISDLAGFIPGAPRGVRIGMTGALFLLAALPSILKVTGHFPALTQPEGDDE